MNMFGYFVLGFADKAALVASHQVGFDRDGAPSRLACNAGGALAYIDTG